MISGIRDIPTMRRVLGEPDAIDEWGSFDDEPWAFRPDEMVSWKRQFTYRSKWVTLVLSVHEADDGSLKAWTISGQPKRDA